MISRKAIKRIDMILSTRRSNEDYVLDETLKENEEIVSFIERLRDYGADIVDGTIQIRSIDSRSYLEKILRFVKSELGEESVLASDIRATVSALETGASMQVQAGSHYFYDDLLYLLALFDCHV